MPQAVLYTIGYQGRSAADLTTILKQHGVTLVLDVRANPFSRRKEFCGPALKERLEQEGIAYAHLPALGNPFRAAVDFDWRVKYERYLAQHSEIVDAALKCITDKTGCLLCLEKDPVDCHRTLAAEAIRLRTGDLDVKPL